VALAEAFASIADHLEMPNASYPEETRLKLLAANKQASDKAVDTLDGRSFVDNIKATKLSLTSLGQDHFSPSIASWLGFFFEGKPVPGINSVLTFLNLPLIIFTQPTLVVNPLLSHQVPSSLPTSRWKSSSTRFLSAKWSQRAHYAFRRLPLWASSVLRTPR
jgi:hypothetical protein